MYPLYEVAGQRHQYLSQVLVFSPFGTLVVSSGGVQAHTVVGASIVPLLSLGVDLAIVNTHIYK